MSIRAADGTESKVAVLFELSQDVMATVGIPSVLGYLTYGFYHTKISWIQRNLLVAKMIGEAAPGVKVAVSFISSRLKVEAQGPSDKVIKLTEELAKGWTVLFDGKERELRIGTADECDKLH